jgi:hypothetical protein
MAIGDVRQHDPKDAPTPNDTISPTQDHDQEYEQEKDEDHDQEESNDQEGSEDDGDQDKERPKPAHLRVLQTVPRDHPMDNIFGDIEKRVTTRSRIVTFCEHYLFVSSM